MHPFMIGKLSVNDHSGNDYLWRGLGLGLLAVLGGLRFVREEAG